MKKFISLSLIAISISLFTACKKDSGGSNTNYYIKANVGGTDKNYTSNLTAVVINTSGVYSLSIAGGAGGSSLEGLAFQINENNNTSITASAYNENSSDYSIAATYNPGSSDVSAIFGAGFKPSGSNPLQIVISNISDKEVSGTFSGEFYDNSGTGYNSLLVSNGEFKVPIQ